MGRARKFREVWRREKWDSRNYRFTRKEAMAYITSQPNWWRGIYKQQTASAMVKRFNEGRLSEKKLMEVLNIFGFYEHQPQMFRIDHLEKRKNLKKIQDAIQEKDS